MERVARHFAAEAAPGLTIPTETVEGQPGLAVHKSSGGLRLRQMTWGFPRQTRAMHDRCKTPGRVGMVADLTNPMWDELAADPIYRCLIPLTHFANPDGDAGAKTRTWFLVRDQPIVAWAGFCRNVPGHGPVYAGMTMEANAAIPPTNDRMPVLLDRNECEEWLQGSIRDVIRFQFRRPFDADRMVVERTDDKWRSGKGPPGVAATAQPTLL